MLSTFKNIVYIRHSSNYRMDKLAKFPWRTPIPVLDKGEGFVDTFKLP